MYVWENPATLLLMSLGKRPEIQHINVLRSSKARHHIFIKNFKTLDILTTLLWRVIL